MLFSLILPYSRHVAFKDVNASYRCVLEKIAAALGDLSHHISHSGISDLAAADRKFSGNAQQRKRTHFLHHGTLLYDFAIERPERLLHQPIRQPIYRRDRSHAQFLTNLAIDADDLIRRLRECWSAGEVVDNWPKERVRDLVLEKHGQEEWIRRR